MCFSVAKEGTLKKQELPFRLVTTRDSQPTNPLNYRKSANTIIHHARYIHIVLVLSYR